MGPIQAGRKETACRTHHRQDCHWKRRGCRKPPIPAYGHRDRWEGNATSGIHGRNELKACGITHMRVGTRHDRFAAFNWLTEGVKNRALEFRKFVQKQNTEM